MLLYLLLLTCRSSMRTYMPNYMHAYMYRVSITDPDDPLTRLVIRVRPRCDRLNKVDAPAEITFWARLANHSKDYLQEQKVE